VGDLLGGENVRYLKQHLQPRSQNPSWDVTITERG
jgi:hypothetical protein